MIFLRKILQKPNIANEFSSSELASMNEQNILVCPPSQSSIQTPIEKNVTHLWICIVQI